MHELLDKKSENIRKKIEAELRSSVQIYKENENQIIIDVEDSPHFMIFDKKEYEHVTKQLDDLEIGKEHYTIECGYDASGTTEFLKLDSPNYTMLRAYTNKNIEDFLPELINDLKSTLEKMESICDIESITEDKLEEIKKKYNIKT